jgi:phospholipid-binding lipoprotein MlaA
MLPVLGPSDVRDSVGRVGDIWLSPQHYIRNNAVSWGLWGLEAVDIRYRLLDTEKLLEGVYDKYAFLRNAYLQRRQFRVSGEVSGEQEQEQEQQDYNEEKQILEESGSAPPPTDNKPLAPVPPKP